jgi:hypothetical protein
MSLFDSKLVEGRKGEAEMHRMFARDFAVTPANSSEDRAGVDLWFERAGIRIGVQVKRDMKAHLTGNLFIETISVDTAGKDGWAVSPRADVLLYCLPPANVVYIIPMAFIRDNLERWRRLYPTRATNEGLNDGYRTHGVCVPRTEFISCRKRPLLEQGAPQ